MSEQRIPKSDEVWTDVANPSVARTVVNVYSDAVTYYLESKTLYAMTLDDFVKYSTPPEPAVIGSRHLSPNEASPVGFYADESPNWGTATHRLDLMSDGEFRVVKL